MAGYFEYGGRGDYDSSDDEVDKKNFIKGEDHNAIPNVLLRKNKKGKKKDNEYTHIKIANIPDIAPQEKSIHYAYACLYSTGRYKTETVLKRLVFRFLYGNLKTYMNFVPLFCLWFCGIMFITCSFFKHVILDSSLLLLLFVVFGITFIRLKCQMTLDEYECYNHGIQKDCFPIYRYIKEYGSKSDKKKIIESIGQRKLEDYKVNRIGWDEFSKSASEVLKKQIRY